MENIIEECSTHWDLSWLGISSGERDLLVDKLNTSEHWGNPPGCFEVASTRPLLAEIKQSLAHSTEHLLGYTWNSVFTFGPCYGKQIWTGWWGSRAGHKCGQMTGMPVVWGKADRTVQPWGRKIIGKPYVQTMFQYLKGGCKGGDLLLQGVTLKRQGVMGASYSGEILMGHKRKIFLHEKIIHLNNPPRKVVDSPKLTLLRLSWTGCWAILFRLWCCQERLGQMILVVPFNLVFYDSIRYVCVYVYAFYNW